MKHSTLAVALTTALTSLLALPCAAQSREGALQLGIGTGFFSHTKTELEYDLPAPLGDADAELTVNSWGFHSAAPTWFEMGYALSDELILGGMLRLGNRNTEQDGDLGEGEISQFEFGLYPKIEYMFLPNGTVRPFVGGGLALVMVNGEQGDTDTSFHAFGLFGRGGLRIFAAPGVSIDPTLSLGWATGSGDYDAGQAEVDIDATLLDVTLGIGISAWIG